MKKLISLVLAAILVFSALGAFTSCGEDVYLVGICQLVQHEALDAATNGFKQALQDKLGDKVAFIEQNASNDPATCTTICNQLIASDVDLILANATPAMTAAASATNKIPILGTSITDFASALDIKDWNGATGKNISGTSDLAPLAEQAEILKTLCPVGEYKTVGILYCSGESNSLYQVKVITPILNDLGYDVKAFSFSDTNDVSAVAQVACNECDVLYIPTDNTAALCADAIGSIALNAEVPIIAGEEGICRKCGVATLSINYYNIGYEAGLMAFEILANGADVSTMQIRFDASPVKEYNKTIADKLGITVPSDFVEIK